MPTPSRRQGDASPPPYTFSTCPEDSLQGALWSRQSVHNVERIEVAHPYSASLANSGSDETNEGDETDQQNSTQPSSRATTSSPRPQSNVTVTTLPEQSTTDYDLGKGQDVKHVETSSRELPAILSPQYMTQELQPDGESVESMDDEDETLLHSLDPDFSSTRVR